MLLLSYLFNFNVTAKDNDSIKHVIISNQLSFNTSDTKAFVLPLDHNFFDVDVNQIYVQIDLNRINEQDVKPFIFLEIKKKSKEQFRLRPIQTKKINLTLVNATQLIDSIELPENAFASGNYDLIVNFMNDSSKVLDIKYEPFQLLRSNTNIILNEYIQDKINTENHIVDITKTFVEKYDLEHIKRNILALSPLAKGVEVKVIKEISETQDLKFLKQFFYNFWYDRNSVDPEKAWVDYTVILNEISKKYGSSNFAGYETDRGRIFIQYGEPDRIEKVPSEKNAKPYEVWFYYQSGIRKNVKFLFYQPGILGNQMMLLNSTEEDELVNPYWKELLLQDPYDGANTLTHKVFEYFK